MFMTDARVSIKENPDYKKYLITVDKRLLSEFREMVIRVHGTASSMMTYEINQALRDRTNYLRMTCKTNIGSTSIGSMK